MSPVRMVMHLPVTAVAISPGTTAKFRPSLTAAGFMPMALRLICISAVTTGTPIPVIQAYGRAVRAEDDQARFYVVDGDFKKLVKDCWPFIPEWFKEALPKSLEKI